MQICLPSYRQHVGLQDLDLKDLDLKDLDLKDLDLKDLDLKDVDWKDAGLRVSLSGFGRGSLAVLAVVAALGAALARENLDAGKSGPALFASTCSACHS